MDMEGADGGGAGQGRGQGQGQSQGPGVAEPDDQIAQAYQACLRGKARLNQLTEEMTKERMALEQDFSKLRQLRKETADQIKKEEEAIATRDKTLSKLREEAAAQETALREENDRLSELREEATAQIKTKKEAIATRDKTLSNFQKETAVQLAKEQEVRDKGLSTFKIETEARDKAILQLREERTELDNRLWELEKRRAGVAEEVRMLEEASKERVGACRKEQQKTAQAQLKMREVEQGLKSLEDLFAGPLSSLRKGVKDLQRKLGAGPESAGCNGGDTDAASERETLQTNTAFTAAIKPPRSLRRIKTLQVPLPGQGQGQNPPEKKKRGRPRKNKGQGDTATATGKSGRPLKKRRVEGPQEVKGRTRRTGNHNHNETSPAPSKNTQENKTLETETETAIDLVDLEEDEETLEGVGMELNGTLEGMETSGNDVPESEEDEETLETETSGKSALDLVEREETLEGMNMNRTLQTETAADVIDPEPEPEVGLETMFAENDDDEKEKVKTAPDVSQGQGQGQGQGQEEQRQGTSGSKREQMPRNCAYCFTPILLSEGEVIHPCEKCKRRVYCSKECRTADWTPYPEQKGNKGTQEINGKPYEFGQGHSTWCGLSYGEEGLDWDIFPTGEKTEAGGLEPFEVGLKARRDFEPGERIFVGGIRKHPNARDWEKIVQMSTDEEGANASFLTTFDYPGRYNVRILISEKAIRKNEEIFVPQFPSQSYEDAQTIHFWEVGWKTIEDVEAKKMPALPGKEAVIRILSEELLETSPLILERAFEDAVTAARQDLDNGLAKSEEERKDTFEKAIKYLTKRIHLIQHLVHPNDPKLIFLRENADKA